MFGRKRKEILIPSETKVVLNPHDWDMIFCKRRPWSLKTQGQTQYVFYKERDSIKKPNDIGYEYHVLWYIVKSNKIIDYDYFDCRLIDAEYYAKYMVTERNCEIYIGKVTNTDVSRNLFDQMYDACENKKEK